MSNNTDHYVRSSYELSYTFMPEGGITVAKKWRLSQHESRIYLTPDETQALASFIEHNIVSTENDDVDQWVDLVPGSD